MAKSKRKLLDDQKTRTNVDTTQRLLLLLE
jgi:hypothetical protein